MEFLFKLEKPLPDFNPQKLELFNRSRDHILQGIVIALENLYQLKEESNINTEVIQTLILLTNDIIITISSQEQTLIELGSNYGYKWSQSSSLFKLAKNYCLLHTASVCIQMWIYNRQSLSDFFAQGEWLVLCLIRLMNDFYPSKYLINQIYSDKVAEKMLNLYREDKLFSLVDFQLSRTTSAY